MQSVKDFALMLAERKPMLKGCLFQMRELSVISIEHVRKPEIVVYSLAVPSGSSKAFVLILSKNMLKRVGESRHPCQTPTVVRNLSPMLLLKRTALVAL